MQSLSRLASSARRPRCFGSIPQQLTKSVKCSTSRTSSIRIPDRGFRPGIHAPSRSFASSSHRRAIRYERFEYRVEKGPESENEPKEGQDGDGPHPPGPEFRWDWRTQAVIVFTGGAIVYYIVHLERVPETGRLRFMDINPKYEAKLAVAAYAELMGQYRGKVLPSNHPITRDVREIVTKILESSNLGVLKGSEAMAFTPQSRRSGAQGDIWDPDQDIDVTKVESQDVTNPKEWNLIVVNDDKIMNAMATYGNIVVFTGILKVCNTDDLLAAVLGHEIAHVVARHASERYSSMKVLLAVASLLEIAGLDFGLARLATTLLLDLPNSREQELEADMIGLRLSAKACYDPQAAPEMQNRLAHATRGQGRLNVDFLYTHPTSQRRIKLLNDLLPEAQAIRAANPACSDTREGFDAFVNLMKQTNQADGEWVWR